MNGKYSGASEIVTTAKRLRQTKEACRRFLMLWALDGQSGHQACYTADTDPDLYLRALKNSDQFAWSALYTADECDD